MQIIGNVGAIQIGIEYSDDARVLPSFHAGADGHGARISIDGLDVVDGWLSKDELAAVRAWAQTRLVLLLDRWEMSSRGRVVDPVR